MLQLPIAAVPTFTVTRRAARERFSSGAELRKYFGLAENTRIVLLSVKDDPDLERYWKYSTFRAIPEYLATLNIEYITGLNFSFANNAPRTVHLVNRARSLRCIEEFSKAGISVIPHLNACTEQQWNFWVDFLKEHPEIKIVSKEFQTGAAIPRIAHWHVGQLERVQEKIGRDLHLVAVGGRRHLQLFSELSGFTIIDSEPFFKTHFRRRLSRLDGQWKVNFTGDGERLDHLLEHNLETYSAGIELKALKCKQYSLPLNMQPETSRNGDGPEHENRIQVPRTDQMSLWAPTASA